MQFLCDVHISYKIVNFLISAGYRAIHINSILEKWFTKDKDICAFADSNDFIIITKDSDFRDSHYVKKSPKKLIKINLESTPKSLLPPNPPFGGLKNSMIFRWFPGRVRGKTDENH